MMAYGRKSFRYNIEPKRFAEDRTIREAMFGGDFGAFGTAGCHFFNPNHPTYLRSAAMARLRNSATPIGRAPRRGKLYPRETAYLGYPFALPKQGEIAAWSLVHNQTTVIVALNTHASEARGADVTIDI